MRTRTVVAAIATFTLGMGVMSQATADPEPAERTTARAAHRALADARAVLDRERRDAADRRTRREPGAA